MLQNDSVAKQCGRDRLYIAERWMGGKEVVPANCNSSFKTRPDTRLPKSRAGGQELYLRSLHQGRSSEARDRKNPKKVRCDGRTDGPTDRQTDKAGCRVA